MLRNDRSSNADALKSVAIMIVIAFFSGCSGLYAKGDNKTGIANPASVNCIHQGGNLSIQKSGSGGEYGICTFEDNQQCEEWALFRGECPAGGRKITGYVTPAARYCVITGGSYKATGQGNGDREQGTCSFDNGKRCDVLDYYNGRCSNALDEKPQSASGKSIGNLHMHTTCSDGKNSYEEMVQQALHLNFDFISVTDHQFGGSPRCDAVIQQCIAEKRLLCIPGMEVTGNVHLLAIGIHNTIDNRLPVRKQVEEIHQQGGLAIAAHPFRIGNSYTDRELFESGLDAIECKGILTDWKDEYFSKLQENNIPCVYNSDAHNAIMLLANWNVCEGKIKSFDDLKEAINERKCNR